VDVGPEGGFDDGGAELSGEVDGGAGCRHGWHGMAWQAAVATCIIVIISNMRLDPRKFPTNYHYYYYYYYFFLVSTIP
jgi:hypothetical protein